jgi:putative membrane protein
MMEFDYLFYGFGGIVMWIIVIALVAIIIYLAVQKEKAIKHEEKETPLGILKKRYAKGELTKKDFEAMKKDLGE